MVTTVSGFIEQVGSKNPNIFNSLTIPSSFKKLYSTCRHWSVSQPISVHIHRRRNLGGGGVTPGACAPPKFHKLSCSMCSFKLCPPPPIKKSFLHLWYASICSLLSSSGTMAITYMVPAAADGCIWTDTINQEIRAALKSSSFRVKMISRKI